MRHRKKRRLRAVLMVLLCLPVLFCGGLALRQLWPAGGAGQTVVLAGSFLAAPRTAVETLGQLVTIEDDSAQPETSGGGFWTEVRPSTGASSASAPAETPAPQSTAEEKPANAGTVVDAAYTGTEDDLTVRFGDGLIKNVTDLPNAEVLKALARQMPFTLQKGLDQPQVLIMHTHATECYQPQDTDWYDPAWPTRSTDTSQNMVAVGKELADTLNAAGIVTLQDATLHDYPSYNGSYDRSRTTVEGYLQKYPSICVVLDIHRDAIEQQDGTRVRPVITVNGARCAQLMIICGADNGRMNMPNYKQNLRFAGELQNELALRTPQLARPVLFDYRNYNQQLTTGSLLVEVGGHANTLDQAKRTAVLLGEALAAMAQ